MTLLSDADRLKLGEQTVEAVYAGDSRVWPSEFTPASLPGLTVWVDASRVASVETGWVNLGSRPDGTVLGSPPPVLRPAGLNGKPVVRFTFNEGRMRWNGTSGLYKDYTVAYVGRCWDANHPGRVLNAAYPLGGNLLFGYWTNFMDVGYATPAFFTPETRKPTTTEWKLYSADCDTPTVIPRLFSDGALLGQCAAPPAHDGFGGTLNLSGYDAYDPSESASMEIAEVVTYNRKLSDADRQLVEDYLREKWLPWTPASVPGLGLWLEADQITGLADEAPVDRWPDASGHGRDGVAYGPAPVFQATAFGGRPSVDFRRNNRLRIGGWGTALAGKADYTLFQVLKVREFGYNVITTAPIDNVWQWITEWNSDGTLYWGNQNGFYRLWGLSAQLNAPMTLTYAAGSGGQRLFSNGNEITSYSNPGAGDVRAVQAPCGADALLGGYFDGSLGTVGNIAAVLWYDRALSDVERQTVEAYLAEKWMD